jgi:hypothetical protein
MRLTFSKCYWISNVVIVVVFYNYGFCQLTGKIAFERFKVMIVMVVGYKAKRCIVL